MKKTYKVFQCKTCGKILRTSDYSEYLYNSNQCQRCYNNVEKIREKEIDKILDEFNDIDMSKIGIGSF